MRSPRVCVARRNMSIGVGPQGRSDGRDAATGVYIGCIPNSVQVNFYGVIIDLGVTRPLQSDPTSTWNLV